MKPNHIRYLKKYNVRIPVDINVKASRINLTSIRYKCPFCCEEHIHGSCKDITNRIETRLSHCLLQDGYVNIKINDDTKRE
jgi:hypothetical protein